MSFFLDLVGGYYGYKQNKKAAKKAEENSRLNARDLLAASKTNASEIKRIAGLNADAVLQTANLNAESVLELAMANANAHMDTTLMNVGISEKETLEALRRQSIRAEQTKSTARAAQGASGVRVGTGSHLQHLVGIADDARNEAQWLGMTGKMRAAKIAAEGSQRAYLTQMEGAQQADLMMKQAGINATLMREDAASRAAGTLRDAELNAKSMTRSGSLLSMNYRNQATTRLIQGFQQASNKAISVATGTT